MHFRFPDEKVTCNTRYQINEIGNITKIEIKANEMQIENAKLIFCCIWNEKKTVTRRRWWKWKWRSSEQFRPLFILRSSGPTNVDKIRRERQATIKRRRRREGGKEDELERRRARAGHCARYVSSAGGSSKKWSKEEEVEEEEARGRPDHGKRSLETGGQMRRDRADGDESGMCRKGRPDIECEAKRKRK